jgi:hypothetical protein
VRDELAENLLTKVMHWSDAEKTAERAFLQDLARYKYDEYQQYAPGRRFIESLALWLRQLHTESERRTAYQFVRKRLIFVSTAEMRSLVELAFPIAVRPLLIERAARRMDSSPLRVKHIVGSSEYKTVLRQTLFLGLSDGARTDVFRRANPGISNEQIWHAYDFSEDKAKSMGAKLHKELGVQLGREPEKDDACFHSICLLDDFTGSGMTYIRDENGMWDGKIPRIVQKLTTKGALNDIVAKSGLEIVVCIYVASDQARHHIEGALKKFQFGAGRLLLRVIHQLPPETRLYNTLDAGILSLANDDRYFDKTADDEHTGVAGKSSRLGYDECRLPVILSHNTPNNSIFLLRGEYEHSFTGLFPRISRHKRVD